MARNRRFGAVNSVACIVFAMLVCLAVRSAHGHSWTGDSLELVVADADVVVLATIESSEPIVGSGERKCVLRVKETLKGKVGETVACIVSNYESEADRAKWEKNKSRLLVCLIKVKRDQTALRKEPLAAEWVVRPGRAGGPGMIALDGEPGWRAGTMDFVFLKKAEDILKCAKDAIKADAETKVAREADGGAAWMMIGVPPFCTMDDELNSRSSNHLDVPVNEIAEGKAREWLKPGKEWWWRGMAARVLGHFKSEENIAALKGLLTDPEFQSRRQGAGPTLKIYPVRTAALAALKAWGVEATAVVEEPE